MNTILSAPESVLKQVSITIFFIDKGVGEKISFDQNLNRWEPENTPLIRLSFDYTDTFQASRQVKPITLQGLRVILDIYLVRCGLRQVEHLTENKRRVRKNIMIATGFRKRTVGIFIEAGLNHEIRELLVDHATGLDASYFRPSEKQVLEEYLKAESLLTIDPRSRLQQENEILKSEKIEWKQLAREVDELKRFLRQNPS